MNDKVVVITGANRGLGFAMCDKISALGATVIMVCRDAEKAQLQQTKFEGRRVFVEIADMTNLASIEQLSVSIDAKYQKVDVLINNAAVNIDGDASRISNIDLMLLEQTMQINFYGPLWMCKQFVPLLKKAPEGRIINFSSGLGQLSVPRMGHYPAYSISKTAINAVTKILDDELQHDNIFVTSVDPGWVRTDLGGSNAELSIEEGIDTPVWLATAPISEIKRGCFYKERKELTW